MNASRINEDNCYCFGNRMSFSSSFFASHNYIEEENDVLSTKGVLLQLYQGQPIDKVTENLQKVRLNPNWLSQTRDDLEYYIPQIITFLVFRENKDELISFLFTVCEQSYFFAHLTYFQIKSHTQIINNKKVFDLKEVQQFLDDYTKIMMEQFGQQYLVNGAQFLFKEYNNEQIQLYGTAAYDHSLKIAIKDIKLTQYISIYDDPLNLKNNSNGFLSTINFWNDIITISERLHLAFPQIISLKADLQRINQRLPSCVYIPFVKEQIRNYVILNIVAQESKVFSTKERAPFYICLEIFRPDAENDQQNDLKQSEAVTLQKSFLQSNNLIQSLNGSIQFDSQKYSNVHKISLQNAMQVIEEDAINETPTGYLYCPKEEVDEEDNKSDQFQSFQKETIDEFEPQRKSMIQGPESQSFFGESSQEQLQRIREQSPFGNLKSWRLVHLIVKSGDNLKQEQFAMQLISTIDQIFAKEDLPMKLSTYEVISLGPHYGLIEMVKDAATIDSLKKKLYDRQMTLRQFFDENFSRGHRKNFMHSLVGYSLACYVMQLKDRHNGNILLKRDGHIVHIDFGFFLGNAPGKGIELENKVPFKLMSEHIEILGGVESDLFKKFRELFYKGFLALRQHSDQILLLVKMMYSAHRNSMPCFKRGDKTITQLEERFYLDENNEAELNVICQNLINQSIDNWRAKWYDKYQYYVQGIFY